IQLLQSEKKYKSYVAYIWQTVMSYFENLKKYRSMNYILQLENYVLEMKPFNEKNLFMSYVNRVKYNYISSLGKPFFYAECVKKYNDIKSRSYLPISSSFGLLSMITNIINFDLQDWISKEGAYDFSNYKIISKNSKAKQPKSQLEELIQKTIKTQFENFLLKKGLRENEIKIRREEQLLSDERTDFIISYGFIGQILIEIKLITNPDANNKIKANEYKQKVLKYIEGTKSDYGIFLIFQTNEKIKWAKIEPMLNEIYKDENKIKLLGLNCIN